MSDESTEALVPLRRKRVGARSRVINVKRISKAELERGRAAYADGETYDRPATRADCASMPRPCPFVSCRYHLYLDVKQQSGSIKINFPDIDPEEMKESCVLDVAAAGGITLEEVGVHLNMTRERVRQIETDALFRLHRSRKLSMALLRDGEEKVAK
jgi:hypothetical protein